jgi:hypothetical protein
VVEVDSPGHVDDAEVKQTVVTGSQQPTAPGPPAQTAQSALVLQMAGQVLEPPLDDALEVEELLDAVDAAELLIDDVLVEVALIAVALLELELVLVDRVLVEVALIDGVLVDIVLVEALLAGFVEALAVVVEAIVELLGDALDDSDEVTDADRVELVVELARLSVDPWLDPASVLLATFPPHATTRATPVRNPPRSNLRRTVGRVLVRTPAMGDTGASVAQVRRARPA